MLTSQNSLTQSLGKKESNFVSETYVVRFKIQEALFKIVTSIDGNKLVCYNSRIFIVQEYCNPPGKSNCSQITSA